MNGLLFSGSTYTTIADPLATFTQALGINAAGQIVGLYGNNAPGTHGFLLSGGTYTTIDDPSATNITEAFGINDRGQIVGAYTNASGDHGFLLSGGVYTTLDDSAGVQAHDTQAIGINNAG
jgi:probable HAF family extracellular repeat protein